MWTSVCPCSIDEDSHSAVLAPHQPPCSGLWPHQLGGSLNPLSHVHLPVHPFFSVMGDSMLLPNCLGRLTTGCLPQSGDMTKGIIRLGGMLDGSGGSGAKWPLVKQMYTLIAVVAVEPKADLVQFFRFNHAYPIALFGFQLLAYVLT